MWWIILICLSPVLFILCWGIYYMFLDPTLYGGNQKVHETAEWLTEVSAVLKCPRCDHSLSHQGFQLHYSEDFKPTPDNIFELLTVECDSCGVESTFQLDSVRKTIQVLPESE